MSGLCNDRTRFAVIGVIDVYLTIYGGVPIQFLYSFHRPY